MTIQNDFLPVATEGTPNVQSQVAYAGSTNQQQGFADGAVPPAKAWNKMMRQATFMASVLASVIVALTGQPMADDGALTSKTALLASMFRYRATANTSFYISTSGNDSTGDGTSSNPWRTKQHAVNFLFENWDAAGFTMSIVSQDSVTAYTDPVIVSGQMVGQAGPLVFTASSPSNVTVDASSSATAYCYEAFGGAFIRVENQYLINSVGNLLYASQESILHHTGCKLGACNNTKITADRNSMILATGGWTDVGDAQSFAAADNSSSVQFGGQLATFSGTPVYSVAYVVVTDRGGINAEGATFSGSFSGKRYLGTTGGGIKTGSSSTFFPGTIAGTVDAATYSWYA